MEEKEFTQQAQLEQFRSVMEMAIMAVKNAILINGGAAIALLTFLGNTKRTLCMSWLLLSLQLFCFGVALAAFATAFGYFAQNRHLTSIKNNECQLPGERLGFIAACLVLLSYSAFIIGCLFASFSFK